MAADQNNLAPETPAETPAPKPLQTAEQKALTSHLAGVKLPDNETEGEEAAATAVEIKLPKTLKASHDLLVEVQDSPVSTPEEAKAKAKKIDALRDHIFALGQGTKTPAITAENQGSLSNVHSDHAEEIHLTLLCRTDRIVDKRLKADANEIAALKAKLKALTGGK